jgi:hypothetical protein
MLNILAFLAFAQSVVMKAKKTDVIQSRASGFNHIGILCNRPPPGKRGAFYLVVRQPVFIHHAGRIIARTILNVMTVIRDQQRAKSNFRQNPQNNPYHLIQIFLSK